MSRIHEALKRAEQERAASQGGHVESLHTMDVPAVGSAGAPPVIERAPLSTPASAAAVPAFSNAFTFDTLLARCAQSEWNPDPKSMLFFNEDERKYGAKVLVTSALPKEGKTFVAANLAQVMVRQHGRRALLIDADLRGARLHQALGTSSTPGLSEYLLGESDEFSVMQRGPMENLFFIPSGRTVSNPAELVANGRLKFLLTRVEPLFDWIIIDSPPTVPVSDSSLLANFCDGVLIVVRSNTTPFDMARKARHEFQDKHLIGVVLNGIEADSSPYSRYYYGVNGNNKETQEAVQG